MHTRQLGPFSVSAIGLGCMNLSHAYGAPVSREQGERVLLAALDAGALGFTAQVVAGGRVVIEQPKYRLRYTAQDRHPRGEHLRVQLVGVVEGGEDELVFRQAQFLAGHGLAHFAARIAGQESRFHIQRLFAEQRQQAFRQREAVGDHMVDARQPAGTREAEVADLHRGGAVAQDGGPCAAGQALQVDQHVDALRGDQLRGRGVVAVGHVRGQTHVRGHVMHRE